MRRIITITLIILTLILIVCSCTNEKTVSITANYTAQEGGFIQGESQQVKSVSEGESVAFTSVTAVANEGYRFIAWDDGNTSAARTDTLSQSKSFVATFEKIDYAKIIYQASENGKIVGITEQTIEIGKESTQVEAVANEGYHFISWSDGIKTPTRTDIASNDITITANFEKDVYVTITYMYTDGGGLAGEKTQTILVGAQSTPVKAVPFSEYDFIGWDDGVTDIKRTDIGSTNKTVTAIFAKKEFTITYLAQEGGALSGITTQTVKRGEMTQRVTPKANEGFVFVGWDDGAKNLIRFDIADADKTYTAIFKKACNVEFICKNGFGTIKGKASQVVGEGEQSQTVTAVPCEGYQFLSWSNGVTTPELTVFVNMDLTFTAYFSPISTGLPVVTITTENGKAIDSKDTYVACDITILDTETGNDIINQTAQIKGRGNSTWEKFDKKPYKIKFDSKQSLFEYGKAKDWVLLADYIDGALVRNMLAYKVAIQLSELGSTPNCQSVEVYLNGEYRGVYLLCEQVEVNEHRVEISEDETAVDTGYLVEMDGWKDDVQVAVPDNLNGSRKYTVKAPDSDVITAEQKAYIQQYLRDCISAIQGTDYERVKELIDIKSFAQAYIVYELFKNPDVDYSSVYFHKDVGGKLRCGPVWDFDMSIGNVNHKGGGVFQSTEALWTRDKCPWFNALLKFDDFSKAVGEELLANKDIILQTLEKEYAYIYNHSSAYLKNFTKWDVLGKNTWTNPSYIVAIDSWDGQVNYTRAYLKNSLDYLIKYYAT